MRDGLPSNYLRDMVEDHKGYIWLATANGLAKFDGYQFFKYTTEDGLADNITICLAVDQQGKIWAGNNSGGLSVINEFGIKIVDESAGLISGAINLIFVDQQNRIWACGLDEGVSVIQHDTLILNPFESLKRTETAYSYMLDKNGSIWLGTGSGVIVFDSNLHASVPAGLEKLIVRDLYTDQQDRIWIATEGSGVFMLDKGRLLQYNTTNGLTSNIALCLMESNSGEMLVGTYNGGLNIIRNNKVDHRFIKQTRAFQFWQMLKDSQGNVWARTLENGVVKISQTLENYSVENNLVNPYVFKISEDSYGNIWILTEGGISKYSEAFFEVYREGFVYDDKHILSLHIAPDETILAGTSSGLTLFRNALPIQQFTDQNGLPKKPAVQSIISHQNKVFLGTNNFLSLKKSRSGYVPDTALEKIIERDIYDLKVYNDFVYGATTDGLLIYHMPSGEHTYLNSDDGLISNDMYSVEIDSAGRIWCGTAYGLSVYSDSVFYNFTTFNGLPNNFCNDITFDRKGVAWIATDNGVCSAVLSEKNVFSTRNYTTKHGLSSNSTVSIISDMEGKIWIGHNLGVDRLDPVTKDIKHFGYNEGFLSVENNLGAMVRDKQGNIWFGTADGIIKYSQEHDLQNETPPKVYIRNIHFYNDTSSMDAYYSRIDSTTLLPADLRLHHRKKNLYFDYVGLHYTLSEKNTYRYRLLGYDEQWSEPTTAIKSIPYQKLPHGKYTFQVMAANCDGVWNETPAEFSFEILAPFWKKWWFRIIEISSLLLLLFLIIYLRERKLRNDKKVLQQRVKERTLEIEKQKDQIQEQHNKIAQQKKEITDSIHYARHIQSAILPNDDTIAPLLKDYFILYKPRDIVSGDFYWIQEKDDKAIVIAADCTGHGVPGAFMSMLGVSTLNEIATRQETLKAGEILDQLRNHIISTLSHTRKDEEARDGMDVAMCIIDFKNRKVQYAGAYNPLIIVHQGEAEMVKADKMPVGLHSGEMTPFSTTTIDVASGDCLYLFSDGYADQFGGPEGKKFKSGAFRDLLVEMSTQPMPEQKQILDERIREWMGDHEQVDDIMVIGIRIN